MSSRKSKDKKAKEETLRELNLTEDELKDFVKRVKKGKIKEEVLAKGYTTYKSTGFGKSANNFFENTSANFIKKHPKFFDKLFNNLRVSGLKIMSRTYVSMILLSAVLAFIVFFILGFMFFFLISKNFVLFALIKALFTGLIFSVGIGWFVYYYPSMVISTRARKIKNELPFVILHMSAVAGSGAHPITVFKLILESEEYKEMGVEVKRIVNYVNLFGYDLTTAMRAVANTTPSERLKELLNGMIATIETGGDLKEYLKNKSEDSMNTYKLERKKYVESLATYSDVYTGVLIAAPLLFIVALAIINFLGGQLFGFSISKVAAIGTYAVLPVLNIVFLLFINIMQPET